MKRVSSSFRKKSFSSLPSSGRKFISKSSFIKKAIPGMLGNAYRGTTSSTLKRKAVTEMLGEKMSLLDPKRAGKKSVRSKFLSRKEFAGLVATGLENIKEKGIRATTSKPFREKKPEELFKREAVAEYSENNPPPVEKGPTREEEQLAKAQRRWRSRQLESTPSIDKLEGDQKTPRQKTMERIGEIQKMARETQKPSTTGSTWKVRAALGTQPINPQGTPPSSFRAGRFVATPTPPHEQPNDASKSPEKPSGEKNSQESELLSSKPADSVDGAKSLPPEQPRPGEDSQSAPEPSEPEPPAPPEKDDTIESNLPL